MRSQIVAERLTTFFVALISTGVVTEHCEADPKGRYSFHGLTNRSLEACADRNGCFGLRSTRDRGLRGGGPLAFSPGKEALLEAPRQSAAAALIFEEGLGPAPLAACGIWTYSLVRASPFPVLSI